jgi:hypothetical protein
MLRNALIIIMLLFIFGCEVSNSYRDVSGTVSDSSTEDLLDSVTVQIGYQFNVTETKGNFFIENPPLGVQTITASKIGYHTYSGTVEVIKGTSLTHDIEMSIVDTVPEPPTSVIAASGDEKIAISWNEVTGATAYNIYWQANSGVTKDSSTKISDVVSPYLHTNLTNGTSYYYSVTAENSFGESNEAVEVNETPSTCPSILDGDTLSRLTINFPFGDIQMLPGKSRSFELGVPECCHFFNPIDACVTWSVTPAEGATINPITSVFKVTANVPHGTVYTICADVEEGRRVVTRNVYVYTPEANPLVGTWEEIMQLSCIGDRLVPPEEPINEIIFYANGEFCVTWFPFEIYIDYWGTYAYDLDSGNLNLTVEGGNYVPDDIDGNGQFVITSDGQLILKNIWLGSPWDGNGIGVCGHILS